MIKTKKRREINVSVNTTTLNSRSSLNFEPGSRAFNLHQQLLQKCWCSESLITVICYFLSRVGSRVKLETTFLTLFDKTASTCDTSLGAFCTIFIIGKSFNIYVVINIDSSVTPSAGFMKRLKNRLYLFYSCHGIHFVLDKEFLIFSDRPMSSHMNEILLEVKLLGSWKF